MCLPGAVSCLSALRTILSLSTSPLSPLPAGVWGLADGEPSLSELDDDVVDAASPSPGCVCAARNSAKHATSLLRRMLSAASDSLDGGSARVSLPPPPPPPPPLPPPLFRAACARFACLATVAMLVVDDDAPDADVERSGERDDAPLEEEAAPAVRGGAGLLARRPGVTQAFSRVREERHDCRPPGGGPAAAEAVRGRKLAAAPAVAADERPCSGALRTESASA